MKIHGQEILKRNFEFILFLIVIIVSISTSILCIKAILNSTKPIIIGIDSNGTRIVSDLSDPIYKTEAISFVKLFLTNTYNFNSNTFIKRFGYSTALMSDSLWKKKENEIIELKAKIEADSIEIKSDIEKITLDNSNTYHSLLVVNEKNRMNEQLHIIAVSLKLKKTARNTENPYGLEIDSYEENPFND